MMRESLGECEMVNSPGEEKKSVKSMNEMVECARARKVG